jgi:hypothetical protein
MLSAQLSVSGCHNDTRSDAGTASDPETNIISQACQVKYALACALSLRPEIHIMCNFPQFDTGDLTHSDAIHGFVIADLEAWFGLFLMPHRA